MKGTAATVWVRTSAITVLAAAIAATAASRGVAQEADRNDPAHQPRELGLIAWHRTEASARAAASISGRPILVVFQEVPGWSTCVDFGAQVLSHPLIVEAATTHFEPLCVYNNTKDDDDATTRAAFGERAWNNPVVRIVDGERRDLATALTDQWTVGGVARLMVAAQGALGPRAPQWLRLLAATEDVAATEIERAVFGRGWFWEGEAEFGLIDGVLDTEALWLGPAEGVADGVAEGVAVTFDRRHLPFARLLQHAIAPGCDRAVWTTTDAQLTAAAESIGAHAQPLASLTRNQTAADGETVRPDREQNYYLRQTPLRHVPMTTAQATRLNAALGTRGLAATGWQEWLSPLQLAHLATVQKAADHPWPILFDMEPTVATHAFTAARRRANDRK